MTDNQCPDLEGIGVHAIAITIVIAMLLMLLLLLRLNLRPKMIIFQIDAAAAVEYIHPGL